MSLMARRRALLGRKKDTHPLPSEYQRVEYVKNPSSGGAYFETSTTFGNPYKISLVAQKDSASQTYDRVAIGSRQNSKNYNQIVFSKTTHNFGFSSVYSVFGNCVGIKTAITAEYNSGHKIVKIQNSLGTFEDNVENSDNIATAHTIAVFQTGKGLAATQFNDGRIYELSVVNPNTGEERVYLIPCYRKSDGKTGMYDTVAKKIYVSTGGTDFEKGADV